MSAVRYGVLAALGSGRTALHEGLHWASRHTGLPAIVLLAVVVVASFRVFRHALRFALEVAFALTLLTLATRWGLVRW